MIKKIVKKFIQQEAGVPTKIPSLPSKEDLEKMKEIWNKIDQISDDPDTTIIPTPEEMEILKKSIDWSALTATKKKKDND